MSPRSHRDTEKTLSLRTGFQTGAGASASRGLEVTEVTENTEKPEVLEFLESGQLLELAVGSRFGGLSGTASAESSRPARKRRISNTATLRRSQERVAESEVLVFPFLDHRGGGGHREKLAGPGVSGDLSAGASTAKEFVWTR
jgi:hypothetical protein